MLDHQDEIATSYRRSCTDLKERLRIGLDKIYFSYKESYGGNFTHEYENYFERAFDSLFTFERRLLQYVRVKQTFQTENKTLQMKIKELQLELKAKSVCLMKLKNDIASHYVQIEFLRGHNRRLESDLENNRRKLLQFQKSIDWLKRYLVSIQMSTTNEKEFISDKNYRRFDHKTDTNKEKQQTLPKTMQPETYQDDFAENDNGHEEWKIFHTELIKMCYENSFLKQALQKLGKMNVREENLNNAMLESENRNSKIFQLQDTHENKEFLPTQKIDNDKNGQIQELNTIIEGLTFQLLQMRFEKQSMDLSVFKIQQYFLKMKEIHAKLKLKICPDINSSTFSGSEKVLTSSEYNDKILTDEKLIQESATDVKCFHSEKLQMQIEHHEELSVFTEKFAKMQHILDSMKEVCENTSDDGSIELSPECSSTEISKIKDEEKTEKKIVHEVYSKNKRNNEEMKCSASDDNFEQKQKTLKAIIVHFLLRMKDIKEKYENIDSVSSENLRILKSLGYKTLISDLRNLKVEAMVRSKQLSEQNNRFEKYKRFLLSSVKQYRQSCISKEKENGKLQSSFITIVLELKLLMNYISENKQYFQTQDSLFSKANKNFFDEVIQRIDTVFQGIPTNIKSEFFGSEPEVSRHDSSISSNANYLGDHTKKNYSDMMGWVYDKDSANLSGKASVQIAEKIMSLSEEVEISRSVIEKLRKDKLLLEADIRQREILFGKIFNIFKQRVEGMAVNVNEKYFLHRLCNDLRSVNKIYGGQNKVMREVLEDNNICTKSIFLRRLSKCSTNRRQDYIQVLLNQQKDFFKIKEDFSDIQIHLESMKRDVSFLQNIVSKN